MLGGFVIFSSRTFCWGPCKCSWPCFPYSSGRGSPGSVETLDWRLWEEPWVWAAQLVPIALCLGGLAACCELVLWLACLYLGQADDSSHVWGVSGSWCCPHLSHCLELTFLSRNPDIVSISLMTPLSQLVQRWWEEKRGVLGSFMLNNAAKQTSPKLSGLQQQHFFFAHDSEVTLVALLHALSSRHCQVSRKELLEDAAVWGC